MLTGKFYLAQRQRTCKLFGPDSAKIRAANESAKFRRLLPPRRQRPDLAYGYALIKDKSWTKDEVKGRPLGACCNLSMRTGNYEASRVLHLHACSLG